MRGFDALGAAAARGAMWLALPFALLLFVQWPLRSLAPSLSLAAEDMAQVLYAVMLAAALTAAAQADQHLCAEAWAQRRSSLWRARLTRDAAACVRLP